MLEDLGERYALGRVLLEERGDEVLRLDGQVGGHVEVGVHDLVERGAYALAGVEGRPSGQERVHHAAERPDVGLEAVSGSRGDLGRDEVGRAAHGEVLLVGYVELGGEAEVGYLDVHVLGEQEVGEREVAVQYAVRVQVEYAVDDLVHVVARLGLVEAPLGLLQVALHLTVLAQLEHQVHVVLVLEERVELEHARMLEAAVDVDLVLDALRHAARLHALLVDHLDGHILARMVAAGATGGRCGSSSSSSSSRGGGDGGRIAAFSRGNLLRRLETSPVDLGEAALAQLLVHIIVLYTFI